MNICKIWDADYPWDIRVEKVVHSLMAAGHSVRLVCRNQARRARLERNGKFSIHRLPSLPHALGPANTAWNLPFPFNPVWISTLARAIREIQAELILVRDILLALPAAIIGRIYRIPVILDMAENYPAMLQDRLTYTPTSRLGRFLRHPAPARVIERLSIRLVDHVLVVVEESRERLMLAGVRSDRITVVCNTPRLGQWGTAGKWQDSRSHNEATNLVYLGNLDGSRGIDVAIRALRYLVDIGHTTRLSVIGDGPCIQPLRDMVSHLNLADRITIYGRLPFSHVQAVMAQSHIGLIPHYATEAWNTTIPNKLFDYMLLGLPLIVSNAKSTARIVRTVGCGEIFRDRDALDLARCVIALEEQNYRTHKGEKGQAAVRLRYNWDFDSQVLLRAIEQVTSSQSES